MVDEVFYKVIRSDIQKRGDGLQYRGLSRNQTCIGITCTERTTCCSLEGFGKPSQKSTVAAFMDHIARGSEIIHDEKRAHGTLIAELGFLQHLLQLKGFQGNP